MKSNPCRKGLQRFRASLVPKDIVWAPTNGDNGGLEIIGNIDRVTTKNGNDRK